MKTTIKILFILLFISIQGYSQNTDSFSSDAVVSVKTPDVAAFESVRFLPVNEYTGRVAVDIPIHTIPLDGLEIPISISYNSGGVKVNSIASRVGLNWSLNAGGMVSREMKGLDDIRKDVGVVENDVIYSEYGFLVDNVSPQYHPIWEPGRDGQPDLFFAAAPGVSTVFTHTPDATPLELTPQGNRIQTFTERFVEHWHFYNEIAITSPKGFVYTFKEKENSHTTYTEYADENEIAAIGGKTVHVFSSAIHLSTITNPISKRTVTFQYDSLRVENHDPYTTRRYDAHKNFVTKKVFHNDYIDVKLIKKITFDTGEIHFYYSDDRQDLIGDKKLTRIEVIDVHGNRIKSVHFVQEYFSSEDCDAPECLRLKLREVYFKDASDNRLPGYVFEYDELHPLPKRRSYQQDFLGYYNGAHSNSNTKFVPQVYYKPNQGRYSLLPFYIPGHDYQTLESTYSIASDVTYATSASLVKVTYPTGSYAQLEYELNTFSLLSEEIEGGGLRVKTHKIFTPDATLEKEIQYTYENEDGTTSGSILFVPYWAKFFDSNLSENPPLEIHQRSLNGYELTKNSYVGYARVKISEPGNGYQIKRYSAPEDFPNSYPTDFEYIVGTGDYAPPRQAWLEKRIANGTFPNLWQSHEVRRGKIQREETYNQEDHLLKKIEYQYNYSPLTSIATHDNLYHPDGYTLYDDPYYVRANTATLIARNVLSKTIVTEYLNHESTRVESDYFYDDEHSFLTEKHKTVSGGKVLKEKYYYPYTDSIASLPYMNALVALHKIDPIIQKEMYENDVLLSTTRTYYDDWGADKILPNTIASSFLDEALEIKGRFHRYDTYGNPLEVYREKDIPISYIWGYQHTRPIAKLEGISYDAIDTDVISNLQMLSDNDTDELSEQALREAQQALRGSYPAAKITTYTYDPLIGMTSITDLSNRTVFYTYDDYNRLKNTKDDAGNLLKQYYYNYALEATLPQPLNASIGYGESTNDYQWFTAHAEGGSGNYSYSWLNGIGTSSTDFEGIPSRNGATYQLFVDCNTIKYVKLIVTDNFTGETSTAIKVNNNACDYPRLDVQITYGPSNDNSQWFFSNVSGGSGEYSYAWYKGIGSSSVNFENTPDNTSSSYQLSVPCTTLKYVKLVVTDNVTGNSIIRKKSSNNNPCTGNENDH